MQKLNRDIGSSFFTLQEGDRELEVLKKHTLSLENTYAFYYSGRNAFLAVLEHIKQHKDIHTIWLPNYYCDTVIQMLQDHYNDVQFYTVNPFEEFDKTPDLKVFAKQNDVVVLNNFWGLSSFEYNLDAKERPTVIEDHTHGWLGHESLNSNADYCICAIRKYYPIPTGGIAWQPRQQSTPFHFYKDENDVAAVNAWRVFKESMTLKRTFIKHHDASVKDAYLSLNSQGDALLNDSNGYIKPSDDVIRTLHAFYSLNPNLIKQKHLEHIFKQLEASNSFRVIKREGFTPFGLLLLFKSEDLFLNFRKHLVSKGIYPAHLWPNNTVGLQWKYLFNIHVDYRYTVADMDYIVHIINNWNNTNA